MKRPIQLVVAVALLSSVALAQDVRTITGLKRDSIGFMNVDGTPFARISIADAGPLMGVSVVRDESSGLYVIDTPKGRFLLSRRDIDVSPGAGSGISVASICREIQKQNQSREGSSGLGKLC